MNTTFPNDDCLAIWSIYHRHVTPWQTAKGSKYELCSHCGKKGFYRYVHTGFLMEKCRNCKWFSQSKVKR